MSQPSSVEMNELMNAMAGGHRLRLKRRATLVRQCLTERIASLRLRATKAHPVSGFATLTYSENEIQELEELKQLLTNWLQDNKAELEPLTVIGEAIGNQLEAFDCQLLVEHKRPADIGELLAPVVVKGLMEAGFRLVTIEKVPPPKKEGTL